MTVRADTREVKRKLKSLERQVPFAMAKAINRTAEQVQSAQRQHQRRAFNVRRPTFVDRGVKISRFATKRAPIAHVGISPPGGAARASILTQHEPGGTKRPKDGRSLTVPHGARRGKRDLVPARLRPKNLGLAPHGQSGRVLVGKERTVLIRSPQGQAGGVILQRKGRRRRSDLVLLYRLAIRAKLSPRLRFVENSRRVITGSLVRNVQEAIHHAIATAR